MRKAKPGAERASRASRTLVLLAGGNPQIAMADGDAPVQAYIAARNRRSTEARGLPM